MVQGKKRWVIRPYKKESNKRLGIKSTSPDKWGCLLETYPFATTLLLE
jgi:hypothetical protein